MIRKTLSDTKNATFCIELPEASLAGMPRPTGTGFFVSADGWFLTAAHVVANTQGNARDDIKDSWLMKEGTPPDFFSSMCQHTELAEYLPDVDVALLKVDWEKNKAKEWLKDRAGFPFITVSVREMEEGEPVYAFGYPLSEATLEHQSEQMIIGSSALRPRVTSAIVSSTLEQTGLFMTDAHPRVYVLDKALNYGNSGGPIVAEETGRVHALCSRFQPVFVPQHHLQSPNGAVPAIMIPSLYGVVTRLDNPQVINAFEKHGIKYES
jgi:S1-C subfamily serine protease